MQRMTKGQRLSCHLLQEALRNISFPDWMRSLFCVPHSTSLELFLALYWAVTRRLTLTSWDLLKLNECLQLPHIGEVLPLFCYCLPSEPHFIGACFLTYPIFLLNTTR